MTGFDDGRITDLRRRRRGLLERCHGNLLRGRQAQSAQQVMRGYLVVRNLEPASKCGR